MTQDWVEIIGSEKRTFYHRDHLVSYLRANNFKTNDELSKVEFELDGEY